MIVRLWVTVAWSCESRFVLPFRPELSRCRRIAGGTWGVGTCLETVVGQRMASFLLLGWLGCVLGSFLGNDGVEGVRR